MNRYIILLFFLLCLFSCKKNEQSQQSPCESATECTQVVIDTSMNGFLFLPNSYWIYKNDSLNTLDSVVLQSVQIGCEVDPWKYYCYRADYYIMNYKSFPSGKLHYDCIEAHMIMRNCHPLYINWYDGWILFNSKGGPMIDSLRIGNMTFYQLQLSIDSTYCAKNIGIVKIGIYGGTSHLVRWKIFK